MPLYEYRCASCSTRFEQLLPMSAVRATTPCVNCAERATRVVTAVGLHGSARPAPTMASMPTTLAGLGRGGRVTTSDMAHWRRQADVAAVQAERHPELAAAGPRTAAAPAGCTYAPAAATATSGSVSSSS